MAHTYNDLAECAKKLLKVSSLIYTFEVEQIPSWGDSVWPVQKKILEQVLVSGKMLYSSLSASIDFADDEFDNLGTLHPATGPIKEAQELAAKAFGAKKTFFFIV